MCARPEQKITISHLHINEWTFFLHKGSIALSTITIADFDMKANAVNEANPHAKLYPPT